MIRKVFCRVSFFICIGLIFTFCKKDESTQKALQKEVEQSSSLALLTDADGNAYKLLPDGRLFKKLSGSGEWVFQEQYFNPKFVEENYVFTDGKTYRKADNGELVLITNKVNDSFEGYPDFGAIIKKSATDTLGKWLEITLQSPLAPTVADYVALRKCILNETCDFKDNLIALKPNPSDPTDTVLYFHAVAKSQTMVTSKASIENNLNYLKKGDDVWYEAKYFVKKLPYSLVDFETSWFNESPGPRLILEDGCLAVELKFGNKPIFGQNESTKIKLTLDQWVHIKVHLKLSEDNTGIIQVWQDGQLIIDTFGQTLPTSNCIISNLEVGITSTDNESELMMNDVKLY